MEVGGYETVAIVRIRDSGGLDWVLSSGDGGKRTDPGDTLKIKS